MIMASLYKAVEALFKKDYNITHAELVKIFDKANPKTIQDYLSRLRKKIKKLESSDDEPRELKKINLEELEQLIVDQLNRNPKDKNMIQTAVKFLDIKKNISRDADTLDLDKFLRRGKGACDDGEN